MDDKVNYLLFRYDDESPMGGMRDLVSAFQSKEELFDTIESMINSPAYAPAYDHIHFYDVRKDKVFDIKIKKSFEVIDDETVIADPTPTLGEMSGLADLKKEMKNS